MAAPAPDVVRAVVDAACRAPSVHNSQPWCWEFDGHRLHLFADRSRQLRHADPDGRDLLISCGAALHHATVAAGALGWATTVRRLPRGPHGRALAVLDLSPGDTSEVRSAALQAIHRRRTDRRTPSSTELPAESLAALVRVAAWGGPRCDARGAVRSRTCCGSCPGRRAATPGPPTSWGPVAAAGRSTAPDGGRPARR